MAERVVSSLIDRLVPLLTQEAKLLRGIHGEVADIKDELKSIQSFLKDADARTAAEEDMSEGVKTWVKQVTEVAFRIDVAIDQYLLQVAQHGPHRHGFTGSSSGARNVRWQDPRMASHFLEDVEVVGIESPKDELLGWLIKGDPYRTVVSVVGMGGLGKTTLAKKVYDHHMMREQFDCHAWISVSQSYNMMDLVRSMVKQFCKARNEFPPEGIDSTDKMSLISKAREYLQEKRYVVVFDDAWELFSKRAFQFEHRGHCPPMLEKLSHDILEKCEGLPLAIVAIGGLLSIKDKTLFEWQKLHDSLGFELGINPHLAGVSKILSLSFEDLPYNLKSCFLYLGMFPEDYSIVCEKLIRQWIAEGFVKAKEGRTFEEVAQEYLTELIHRCLVQVLEVKFDGNVRQCRVHDYFHEIILQKMKDLSFCHVLSKQESHFEGLTRRMSVDGVSYNVLKGFEDAHIHSLLFFNINEFPISFMSKFLQNFKLAKVLDFENTPLDHLPEEVGNLFHLRYLNLSNTKVKTLPNSIGKLQNLETLLMRETAIQEIPVTINMLHKLRCLIVRYFDAKMEMSLNMIRGVKLHWSIGCLKALTELLNVDANYGGVKLIEELGKLSQLTNLALVNLTRETGRALCVSIENMNCLKDLFVSSINEDEVIDLQPISSPPKCLQYLCIRGRLAELPDWISELQHLVSLNIYWTRLSEDPLIAFQNLPNLVVLKLGIKAYNGEQLQIGKGGFLKLKELCLRDLSELNSLNIEKEAFPLLEKFNIGDCPQLKEVPSGFQHLKNLKELDITEMPTEFEKNLYALHSLLIHEGALPLLENFVIGPSPQLKEVLFGIQHLRSLKKLKFLGICIKNSKKVWILSKGSITGLLSMYQSFISIARFT
ncbi:hypothetical protein ACB098_06G008700 [Castanea mollissima]